MTSRPPSMETIPKWLCFCSLQIIFPSKRGKIGFNANQKFGHSVKGGGGVNQMLTIAKSDEWGWVRQISLRQPKICEKRYFVQTWSYYVMPHTAQHRSKTHDSPSKCHVKNWFCLSSKDHSGKKGSGKYWQKMTRGEGGQANADHFRQRGEEGSENPLIWLTKYVAST